MFESASFLHSTHASANAPARHGRREPPGGQTFVRDHAARGSLAAMHPWHDVYVDEQLVEKVFPAVVEIPEGSKNKYELDK